MLEAVLDGNTNDQLKFKIVMLTVQTANQLAQKWKGTLSVAGLGSTQFHS
jgi:hypothetical protein